MPTPPTEDLAETTRGPIPSALAPYPSVPGGTPGHPTLSPHHIQAWAAGLLDPESHTLARQQPEGDGEDVPIPRLGRFSWRGTVNKN